MKELTLVSRASMQAVVAERDRLKAVNAEFMVLVDMWNGPSINREDWFTACARQMPIIRAVITNAEGRGP